MKKWRKRLGYFIAGLLLVAALLAWEGRAIAMLHLLGGIHLTSPDPDFRKLESRLPLDSPTLAEMYEGLPHPYWDKAGFARELWTTSNQSIAGHRFYKKPSRPSPEVQAVLLDVLNRKESFEPYPGPKMCGGYHADFAVRLESGEQSIWFLVCLGCREVIVQADGKEMICDLQGEAARRLDLMWKDYRSVPFTIVETRLPIPDRVLQEMGGYHTSSSSNIRLVEAGTLGLRGRAYIREQGFIKTSLRLHEETYESIEHADKRMQDFVPRSSDSGELPRRGPFRIEKHVYWLDAANEDWMDRAEELLDHLRRYCEETPTHEVRFYK